MPITQKKLEEIDAHYYNDDPNRVTVTTGPCAARRWDGKKIPLDGRHYQCGGTIILKNERELRAHLRLRTHTFDYLDRESVRCRIGDTWYQPDEPEFFVAIGIDPQDALPYTWLPGRPLDHTEKGPYPMDWYAESAAD